MVFKSKRIFDMLKKISDQIFDILRNFLVVFHFSTSFFVLISQFLHKLIIFKEKLFTKKKLEKNQRRLLNLI